MTILQNFASLREACRVPGRTARHCAWLALFLFAGFVSAAGNDSSQSSVFVVSDGDSELYLAGTVHLLRPSDYPLPEPYQQAYQESEQLYFETDISQMSDISMQTEMMQRLTYQDGRTLEDVLNEEAWQALNEYIEEVGLQMAMVQSFKPGLLVSTLSVLEFQRLGFTPQGIDMYFSTRATGEGKTTGELEEIDEQIDLLANMGVGYESEFILYSLEDMRRASQSIEEIIRHWRSGDMEQLQSLFVEPMKDQSGTLYQELLVDRNHNWMPTIEELLEDDESSMVLVGVAHLVGEDGLLSMLESQGYSVEQL